MCYQLRACKQNQTETRSPAEHTTPATSNSQSQAMTFDPSTLRNTLDHLQWLLANVPDYNSVRAEVAGTLRRGVEVIILQWAMQDIGQPNAKTLAVLVAMTQHSDVLKRRKRKRSNSPKLQLRYDKYKL